MTEEGQRSSAAEIPVTSNGDLDQSPEAVFQRVRALFGEQRPSLLGHCQYSIQFILCSPLSHITNYNGHSVERIPSHIIRLGIEL